MNRLQGKVSLITGANSGIGRRTAEVFADEGSDLVLVARRIEKLREVEDICKAKAILYFASDDSIAVTGQTIVVDRGTSL